MILILIFVTAVLVWGVMISTEPDMVFEKIGAWADNEIKKGNKIWDWILRCPFCMPSLYTSFAYLLTFKLGMWSDWSMLWAYPIVVCGASLVSGMVWLLFRLISVMIRYFKYLNGEEN